ncbi:hypothetical protein ACXR2T_10580 [Leucobacter sp. HY1910]
MSDAVDRIAARIAGVEAEVSGMRRARQLPVSTVQTPAGDLNVGDVLGGAAGVVEDFPILGGTVGALDDAQAADLDTWVGGVEVVEATDDAAHDARVQAIFVEDRSNELQAELDATGERLDAAKTELDGKLAATESAIEAAEESQQATKNELAALDGLVAAESGRIDDATGRLDSAESAIGSAEGRLDAGDAAQQATQTALAVLDGVVAGESARIDGVEGTAGEALDTAVQALAEAPLTAEKLLAVVAVIGEAFIRDAHILDLDVGKLTVTGETVMSEAVIQRLFADVVTARLLEITEKLIGVDGTFTGKLTVDHLDVATLFGQRIDGLEIHGGEFVQYATDTMLPIYPNSAGEVVASDWFGGAPDALAAAVQLSTPVFSGTQVARVHRVGAGSINALWQNNGRVSQFGSAARRVELRVRSTAALTGVHVNTPTGRVSLPNIAANTWVVVGVDLPQGADLSWVHLGATKTATGTHYLYIDEIRILSASLQGAHVRISRDSTGLPGVFIYNAAGQVLAQFTPNGMKTVDPSTGAAVTMSRGSLEFEDGARTSGANTFALKSQLEAWAAPDGTHAWVTSENREYVRRAGAWRRVPIIEVGTGTLALTGNNNVDSVTVPFGYTLPGVPVVTLTPTASTAIHELSPMRTYSPTTTGFTVSARRAIASSATLTFNWHAVVS